MYESNRYLFTNLDHTTSSDQCGKDTMMSIVPDGALRNIEYLSQTTISIISSKMMKNRKQKRK